MTCNEQLVFKPPSRSIAGRRKISLMRKYLFSGHALIQRYSRSFLAGCPLFAAVCGIRMRRLRSR
jgi:hypothetical protein